MYHDFLPFAESLADASGAIIRKYFRMHVHTDTKSDASPVTIADQEAEAAIRELIETHYPEHGIIGEEYGIVREDAPYVWVIDPIDGTKSFMIGRPIFGTLISLLHHDNPVLGMIDQPINGERWVGIKGHGAALNGQAIASCASTKTLAEATICTTARELFNDKEGAAFDRVLRAVKYPNYGGDCYNYALLAMGLVDIVIESGLKPHDFCALSTVITEAGGICTDWEGRHITRHSDGKVVACGNKELHDQVLALLQQ